MLCFGAEKQFSFQPTLATMAQIGSHRASRPLQSKTAEKLSPYSIPCIVFCTVGFHTKWVPGLYALWSDLGIENGMGDLSQTKEETGTLNTAQQKED